MGKKRLSAGKIEQIKQYRLEHPELKLIDIAIRTGVSVSSVSRIVGKRREDTPAKEVKEPLYYRLCNAQVERMIALEQQGMSRYAIAKLYDVVPITVSRAIRRYNNV